MVGVAEVLVAAGGPLVPGGVVHDPLDAGAEAALAVVAVVARAAQEVVVHAKVVAKLVSHQLEIKTVISDKLFLL